jgi:tRNA1Val (adenine37-N6)-methyltransferase
MSLPFQFKEFSINQDRCAMKIGTDGVLLGAWVSIDPNANQILDLGAGTGIIALQLAQRNAFADIDAIEIDDAAFEQCIDNFENSPWADRLFCYHASAQEFATEVDETYDLIVSNPPFYSPSLRKSESLPEGEKIMQKSRKLARFNDALPFEHLIGCVHKLLSEKGIFALILPRKEEESFISLASEASLFPKRICRVRGNSTSEEKRSLLEFSFQSAEIELTELTIETERHQYTDAYRGLVKDFYLKM